VRGFEGQAVLGLQHLWRIGRAMRVGWWTGCLAYVARAKGDGNGENKKAELMWRAKIVGRVWREAHARLVKSNEEDENAEDEEFDVADAALRGGRGWGSVESEKTTESKAGTDGRPNLPDRSCVYIRSVDKGRHIQQPDLKPPPCFIAEVEDLPRNADVEWTSVGVSGKLNQVRDDSTVIETTEAHKDGTWSETEIWWEVLRTEVDWDDKVRCLPNGGCDLFVEVYTSVGVPEWLEKHIPGAMIVPCRSVWVGDGEQVDAVVKIWILDEIQK